MTGGFRETPTLYSDVLIGILVLQINDLTILTFYEIELWPLNFFIDISYILNLHFLMCVL